MKVIKGIIVEATRNELFTYYLKRELDDVYSFPDFVERMKEAGTVVLDE